VKILNEGEEESVGKPLESIPECDSIDRVKSSLRVDIGHKQRLTELTMQLRQDAGAPNCETGLLRATVLDRQTIQTCQENMGKDLPRNRDERDGTMATAFSFLMADITSTRVHWSGGGVVGMSKSGHDGAGKWLSAASKCSFHLSSVSTSEKQEEPLILLMVKLLMDFGRSS
jgi:hypothetical protein